MVTVDPQNAPGAPSGSEVPRTVPAPIRRSRPYRPPEGLPLGEWVFVPGTAGFFGRSSDAYIERGEEHIPLVYCSSELEQFANEMVGIEGDFIRRCSGIDLDGRY